MYARAPAPTMTIATITAKFVTQKTRSAITSLPFWHRDRALAEQMVADASRPQFFHTGFAINSLRVEAGGATSGAAANATTSNPSDCRRRFADGRGFDGLCRGARLRSFDDD